MDRPSPYYVGKGKLEELRTLKSNHDCNLIIFDDELSPTQQQTLERILGEKVIDRTALIIDIFAKHAHSREGQLQVDLAQHEYLLPRLAGQWSHLERLGGGIGTRGPGETQIETDRRLIRGRIKRLKDQLKKTKQSRLLYRHRRKEMGMVRASLVGYTNAGKSTLFNKLSRANVNSENQLFSTLDPITRQIILPGGQPLLITDTVGFINKLPPTLVSAFEATLEDLRDADILIHVIDISSSKAPEQAQVVYNTLLDLQLNEKPQVLALNKMDMLDKLNPNNSDPEFNSGLINTLDSRGGTNPIKKPIEHTAVPVSAITGWNVKTLLETIQQLMKAHYEPR